MAPQVSKQIFEQMDQDGNGLGLLSLCAFACAQTLCSYIDRNEFSSIFSKGGLRITAEVEVRLVLRGACRSTLSAGPGVLWLHGLLQHGLEHFLLLVAPLLTRAFTKDEEEAKK